MSDDTANWDERVALAVYEAQRNHEIELNRATATFEHALVTPLFLLNGGAAVAFLTLLGAASAETSTLDVDTDAAAAWSIGLLAATIAVLHGYLAQRDYTRATSQRRLLLETAIVGPDNVLHGSTAASSADPSTILDAAAQFQRRWLASVAAALVLFVVGVVLASIAVV